MPHVVSSEEVLHDAAAIQRLNYMPIVCHDVGHLLKFRCCLLSPSTDGSASYACIAVSRYIDCAEKNLDVLKGVLCALPENACLCFVGDGPHRAELERHFAGMRVYFTVCVLAMPISLA